MANNSEKTILDCILERFSEKGKQGLTELILIQNVIKSNNIDYLIEIKNDKTGKYSDLLTKVAAERLKMLAK